MNNWKADAIEEIDQIFDWLYKADNRWDRLAKQLTDLLLTKVDEIQKEAINDFIRYIKANEGTITEIEVNEGINLLENKLGKKLAEKLREDVVTYQMESYKLAQTDLGLQFQYSQVDLKALAWLEKDQMYWIGDYYNSQLRDKLLDAGKNSLQHQYDRENSGNLLKEKFINEFEKSQSYWEGLSDHIITRSREFGRTEGYVKAGIKYLRIDAIMDSRTSIICREMNGRIILVSKAVKLRDRLMNASKPEDTKRIAPWLTNKQVMKLVVGVKTEEIPEGLEMPPYHFRCRTRTTAFFENDSFITDRDYGKKLTKKDKGLLDSYTNEEYSNIFGSALDRANEKNIKYSITDINQDMRKHAAKIGIENEEDFIAKANEVMSKSDIYAVHIYKDEIQFDFFNEEGYVILDKNFEIKGYFPHKNRQNTLIALSKLKENRLWLL